MKRILLFVAVFAAMFVTPPALNGFVPTSGSSVAISQPDGPSLPPIEPNSAVAITNTFDPAGPSLPPIEPN